MANINDLLRQDLNYTKNSTLQIKDLGKVDIEIKYHEIGSINSSIHFLITSLVLSKHVFELLFPS